MIEVSLATTPKQDARLAEYLTELNADRAAQGDPPFSDINALAADLLKIQLLAWVRRMEDNEAGAVRLAYASATNSVQAQVKTLLGVS